MIRNLIAIIVIVLIIGGFALLGKTNSRPTAQTTESSNSATVTLTASGFVPKDITIKAGTKVVWINKSGDVATVNSDNHPTHLLYPFLNLGKFADGETLQVIVEKTGSYSYHNHFAPSEKGTITAQ